jgi:hypothetical protein
VELLRGSSRRISVKTMETKMKTQYRKDIPEGREEYGEE